MTEFRRPLYFDNHATTEVDPRVIEAMLPTFSETYGNPESGHPFGWAARLLVESARAHVAKLIGAEDANKEIVFTSGATESIHLAILSAAKMPSAHIITVATEHKATLEAVAAAKRLGAAVTVLPVDQDGCISADQVIAAVTPHTVLVSVMHGNNEIGTLHPVEEIGTRLREISDGRTNNADSSDPRILFHVDAAQTVGKHEIHVKRMCIDLLSFSAHKFHGPKGIGALYVRNSDWRFVHLTPIFSGGGQERGVRSGTLNVPGIVGLGRACELALTEMDVDRERMTKLRDDIINSVEASLKNIKLPLKLNGHRTERLCNNVNFTFTGVEQDELMLSLKDFVYSGGSACAGPAQSHVLKAIGSSTSDPFEATVRIGLSRLTKPEEVSSLIRALIAAVQNAREISASYESEVKAIPSNLNK